MRKLTDVIKEIRESQFQRNFQNWLTKEDLILLEEQQNKEDEDRDRKLWGNLND